MKIFKNNRKAIIAFSLCCCLTLSGCSAASHKTAYPYQAAEEKKNSTDKNSESDAKEYKITKEGGYIVGIVGNALFLAAMYGLIYIVVQSPYVEKR